MRKEIKEFISQKERNVLIIEHHGPRNVMYEWSALRNPLRVIWNEAVLRICTFLPAFLKHALLRSLLGMTIGKNVGMAAQVIIDRLFPELVVVEDNAVIGWQVRLLTHEFTQKKIRIGRICIRDNALVGAFSTVRSGVTIGRNSLVAMNSFVNKDIPDNEVWGGVPAKKIRTV